MGQSEARCLVMGQSEARCLVMGQSEVQIHVDRVSFSQQTSGVKIRQMYANGPGQATQVLMSHKTQLRAAGD